MEKGETLWVDYNKYLFVRVNKIVREEDFRVHNKYLWQGPLSERIRLPGKGKFQIIGKGDAIDWDGIAEKDYFDGIGYQYANYELEHKWTYGERFNKSTESGHSLLRSLKMELGTTFVLKKE